MNREKTQAYRGVLTACSQMGTHGRRHDPTRQGLNVELKASLHTHWKSAVGAARAIDCDAGSVKILTRGGATRKRLAYDGAPR